MKVESKKIEQEFVPFTLEITVESLEEARALYAIFNHTDNLVLSKNNSMGIISELCKNGQFSVGLDEVIANGITYHQFYDCH